MNGRKSQENYQNDRVCDDDRYLISSEERFEVKNRDSAEDGNGLPLAHHREPSRPFHGRNRSYDAQMLNNYKKNSSKNKAPSSKGMNGEEDHVGRNSSPNSTTSDVGSSNLKSKSIVKPVVPSVNISQISEEMLNEYECLNLAMKHAVEVDGMVEYLTPIYRGNRLDVLSSEIQQSSKQFSNSTLNSPCQIGRKLRTRAWNTHEDPSSTGKYDTCREYNNLIQTSTRSRRTRIKSMNEVTEPGMVNYNGLLSDDGIHNCSDRSRSQEPALNALSTIKMEMRSLISRSERYITSIRELEKRKNAIENQCGTTIDEIMRSRDILALTMETKSLSGKLGMVHHFLTVLNHLKTDIEQFKPS